MRRRDHQRDDGGIDSDVDGVIPVITALGHLRDHQATNGRGVGDSRAGNAAEQCRSDDVDLPQTAAQMTDKTGRKTDQTMGYTAADHEVTREDEERDRHHRKHVHAGVHLLEDHDGR
ncbi:hypothetical protein D3C87_1341550 [compost metagenome]